MKGQTLCTTDFKSGITSIGTEQTFIVSDTEDVEAISWKCLLKLVNEKFLHDIRMILEVRA